MTQRAAAWLAWSLWGLFIALAAGLVLLGFLNRSSTAMADMVASLLITTFPTVGALVAARRPRNPIGWLMLAIALSFVSSSFADQYALYTFITAPAALPGGPAGQLHLNWRRPTQ
jgi:hypothetical protein